MKQHSPYQRVETPTLAPGDDYVTRSLKGPFIDTGLHIKPGQARHGRVYLSIDTIREMAEILGLFDEKNEVEEVPCAKCAELEAKIESAVEALQ